LVFCAWVPEKSKTFTQRSWQAPKATGRRLRHIPTGGEVTGGEGPVWHDQQGVGNRLGEVGLDGQRWSPAGDEEGRWPWRHVAVPSGRPVNVTI
jgi:hypothetical protein